MKKFEHHYCDCGKISEKMGPGGWECCDCLKKRLAMRNYDYCGDGVVQKLKAKKIKKIKRDYKWSV